MKRIVWQLFLLVSAISVLCLAYGFLIEPRLLKVRQIHVRPPHWSEAPIRIAIISDIHMGGFHVGEKRVRKIIQTLNRQNADMIIIAGDFISGHDPRSKRNDAFNDEILRGLTAFGALSAPLGVYASMGNHDAWYDGAYIAQTLRGVGLTVLNNEAHINEEHNLCIVGLEDEWTGKPSVEVFNACSKDSKIIAFMHSPDSFEKVPRRTRIAFAGHTHGGQINLPLIGRRVTSTQAGKDYAYGIVDANGVLGFVTAGVGTSILPARFRAPPEIAVITLSAK